MVIISLVTVRRLSANNERDCSNGQYVSELAEMISFLYFLETFLLLVRLLIVAIIPSSLKTVHF